MRVGFSYGDYIEFFEEDGKTALDITADTNRLNYLIGSPVTDTAGVYQARLILTDPLWGNNEPIAAGKIIVKP